MKIVPVCPNSFAANTYLLISDGNAFIVDPSVSVSSVERLLNTENAVLQGILLTHGHFDHTISVDTLRDSFNVPLMIHSADACMLTNGKINGFYDFYNKECVHRPAEKLLTKKDTLMLGNETVSIIETPGHTEGSVCYLCHSDREEDFLITGDTLFSNSIGRCDLWGGNEERLRVSLKNLSALNQNMTIYAGHGPSSSLSYAIGIAHYYLDF